MDKITESELDSITADMEEEEVVEMAAKLLDYALPNDANTTLFLTMLNRSWQEKIGKRFVIKVLDPAG